MSNNPKQTVDSRPSLAFSNTPNARNAVANWLWASQFSKDLHIIIEQLDWRFIDYLGTVTKVYLKNLAGTPELSMQAIEAMTRLSSLSAFLKEHESLIYEFNKISQEIIDDYLSKVSHSEHQKNYKPKGKVYVTKPEILQPKLRSKTAKFGTGKSKPARKKTGGSRAA